MKTKRHKILTTQWSGLLSVCPNLLVVITFSPYYRACPVQLFDEDEACQLVWEGHEGQGQHLVSAGVQFITESVSASDDEDEVSAQSASFF